MSAIRMAISELRRITAGRLPVLAVLALLLIPMLYAGFYLYANGDPYDRLDKVPAALVVEDAGGTGDDGRPQNVGEQVAGELVDSGSFDFHRVTAAEADSEHPLATAIVAAARDSTIGLMRLTWWADALERLDTAPPPAEPVLTGLALHVLPHGVRGRDLAAMVDG